MKFNPAYLDMRIQILRDTETIRYAANELNKYLLMMDPSLSVEIVCSDKPMPDTIKLGLVSDLSLSADEVCDPMIDDLIDVDVNKFDGYISGSNDRSVLMGVYKYLKSCGCRWVRPGKEGEYIPRADIKSHSFTYRKKADFPFRGQAIEGAVSYEHVRDTVYWLPKIGMNLFQIEQVVPYNYMSRWYTHASNTKLSHEDIPYEEYCRYVDALELDIKKCGLQFHALGHGALLEPLGIRYMTHNHNHLISEEAKRAFALVNGKREIYGEGKNRSPSWTQVCMSQEWVQERVINWIVDYLEKKKHIDFLHFWLGDSCNNHCECESCIKKHPSDWYVDMLNKLDEKLTERGSKAKIVFIMYVDTLWPPEKSKLNNPSRFILTTACGTGKGYSNKRREGGIPKWERNKFAIQGGLDMALTFKDGWKSVFDGPSMIYEYWLYTRHFADPSYMTFSRKLAMNIKRLSLTGFDGVMSDQTQRVSFPTALPNSIIGEFLFDASLDVESYIDEYFAGAFGDEWRVAKEYLEKICSIFDTDALTQNTDVTAQDTGSVDVFSKRAGIFGNKTAGDNIAKTPEFVNAYVEAINKNATLENKCHSESWRILYYHGEYCKGLAKVYFALSRNDKELATQYCDELIDYLSEIEMKIHKHFDLYLFDQRIRQIIDEK